MTLAWWLLSIVAGLRVAGDVYAWWQARQRGNAKPAEREKPRRRQRKAVAVPKVHVASAADLMRLLQNSEALTQEQARASLRAQGRSELLAVDNGNGFEVALPTPVPLHPRPIEGEEQRVKVAPLEPAAFVVLLALAREGYFARKGMAS